KEIVRDRHDRPEIFLHHLRVLLQRLGNRHEQNTGLGKLLLKGGRNRDRVEYGIDRDLAVGVVARRALYAEERLALAQRNSELLVGGEYLRIDLVQRFRAGLLLRRGVVIDVLIIDGPELYARPSGLLHGEPAAIGIKPPAQHPLRLILLLGNETDNILGQALGSLFGFNVCDETILILVDVDTAHLIDGLLDGRHSFPPLRGQGPRVGLGRLWSILFFACDLPVQAAATRCCLSNDADTLFQALTKRSTSDSVVVRPKLTRTAARARSGATPIAASTCDGWTLPEEQAAPDDTATPPKSKAITAVSAFVPASAKRIVLGRRSAPLPKITTSGVLALRPASRRSRNTTSRSRSVSHSSRAALAAAPKPAIPMTFSVPAR